MWHTEIFTTKLNSFYMGRVGNDSFIYIFTYEKVNILMNSETDGRTCDTGKRQPVTTHPLVVSQMNNGSLILDAVKCETCDLKQLVWLKIESAQTPCEPEKLKGMTHHITKHCCMHMYHLLYTCLGSCNTLGCIFMHSHHILTCCVLSAALIIVPPSTKKTSCFS